MAVVLAAAAGACGDGPLLRRGVAFFAEHEGGLHLVDASGAVAAVDVGFADVGALAYSESAQSLVFEASDAHDTPPSLFLLGPHASRPKRIFESSDQSFLYRPAFDPAGGHVYALNYATGIFRYSLSSETWEGVPVKGAAGLQPQGLAFSPSGERVAISPGDFGGFLIGEVTPSGLLIEERVFEEFQSCISPRWETDRRLVFAGRKASGVQQLWRADLETGDVEQLTHAPIATRDFLALSPDRQAVVFTATNQDEALSWRLWEIHVDGSGLRQLTKGGDLSGHLGPVYIE